MIVVTLPPIPLQTPLFNIYVHTKDSVTKITTTGHDIYNNCNFIKLRKWKKAILLGIVQTRKVG